MYTHIHTQVFADIYIYIYSILLSTKCPKCNLVYINSTVYSVYYLHFSYKNTLSTFTDLSSTELQVEHKHKNAIHVQLKLHLESELEQ